MQSTVYKPDDAEFADCFIEFSNSWSRAQVRAAWEATGADDGPLLDTLRPKIVRLHLACDGAPPITDAADLTPERTEQMDVRLYAWFAGVWIAHLGALADLGNALRRRLFATSEPQTEKTPRRRKRASTRG